MLRLSNTFKEKDKNCSTYSYEIIENTNHCRNSSLCGFDQVCDSSCGRKKHTKIVNNEKYKIHKNREYDRSYILVQK